jgi:hypothetical protein
MFQGKSLQKQEGTRNKLLIKFYELQPLYLEANFILI